MKTKTTEKEGVRLRAQELGADLVGVLNLADYKSPRSPDPRKYLAGARSVIVLGFRVLSGAYDNDSWTRMHSYLYSGEVAGNMAAYSLAQEQEDNYGARTLIIHPHRPFDLTEETYRMPIGSLSLRHAAVQSGIAVFGKNTLALTPRFGPRLFFFGLLNSLDLPTDPSQVGDYRPCETCSFPCVEACPGNAFMKEGGEIRTVSHRCVRHSQPADPGHFMRFLLELAEKPTLEERKEMLKSARFFAHVQCLQGYHLYYCQHCTKACPSNMTGKAATPKERARHKKT